MVAKFSSEGGVLKVSKGVIIVMKARKAGCLYELQGSIVLGSAAISSSSMLDATVTKIMAYEARTLEKEMPNPVE